MSYLMIENRGVAPLESFLMLGLSDARGDDSRIGQFGSGAKHGVLTCLRAGLQVIVYRGTNKIEFSTVLKHSAIGDYQQLYYKLDGQKPQATNMTLGFGELDWGEVSMALREFICNALDQADNVWSGAVIAEKSETRAKAGHTRVFVEVSPEVRRYLSELNWRFLHPRGLANEVVLKKEKPSPCKLYRKGVFVREVEDVSLFDYNDSAMEIDEARNADSYKVRCVATKLLTDDLERTKEIISRMSAGEQYYESDFSSWNMNGDTVSQAVRELFGSDCYVTALALVAAKVSVSHTVVLLPTSWTEAALSNGSLRAAESLLTRADKTEGVVPVETDPTTIAACRAVWECMVLADMTRLPFPRIRQYSTNMRFGGTMYGFYDPDTEEVWIHSEHATNYKTILEELVHYASGASDETRDFQDFVLRFASRLIS